MASEVGELRDYEDKIPYRAGLIKPGKIAQYDLPENDYFIVIYDKKGNVLEENRLMSEEFGNL